MRFFIKLLGPVAIAASALVVAGAYVHLLASSSNLDKVFAVSGLDSAIGVLSKATIEAFGQWLSGIAGALATIWLVVAYIQSSSQISRQAMSEYRARLLERLDREGAALSGPWAIIAAEILGNRMATMIQRIGATDRDIIFSLALTALDETVASSKIREPKWKPIVDETISRFEAIFIESQGIDSGGDVKGESYSASSIVGATSWASLYLRLCDILDRRPVLSRSATSIGPAPQAPAIR
jgi:hypothetical protein